MKKCILFLTATLLLACQSEIKQRQYHLNGFAQGSTFSIKYLAAPHADFSKQVDSLFQLMDQSMSTYLKGSLINFWNQSDTGTLVDEHFAKVTRLAIEMAQTTGGYFDPTVMPLVRAWGFGPTASNRPDSNGIAKILEQIGYEHLVLEGDFLRKKKSSIQLDFNAIAQGYTVDLIGSFLEKKGVTNYMVEVGGELRCQGKNIDGRTWTIGIDKPESTIQANRFAAIVPLENAALATSGNYRKFKVDSLTGIKYTHSIDPHTGYPVNQSLLSTTVISVDAATADALATSCMVMGWNKAIAFAKEHPEHAFYFIGAGQGDKYTEWHSDSWKERFP